MSCNEFQGRFPLQTYFIFSFQRLVTASQRSVPASVPPDEVAELAVCRAATTISSASAAVNNHLRDKPLDLGGWGLGKGFRAKTGYEINGRTGWRRDVCLHAASKPSEPAGMKDRWEASAVLFHQYCDFFPSSRLILSLRTDSERDIHSCSACWGVGKATS